MLFRDLAVVVGLLLLLVDHAAAQVGCSPGSTASVAAVATSSVQQQAGTMPAPASKPASDAAPQQLVLNHKPAGAAAATPVNFYVFRPSSSSSSQNSKLPLLFLMNGANVEAAQYSEIARQLASKGFTFVGSDYLRPLPPQFKQVLSDVFDLPDTCPPDRILIPSAALLQTFLQHVQSAKDAGDLQRAASNGVVLVSHSLGGSVALDMLSGGCRASAASAKGPFSFCEGFQPPLRPASISSGAGKCSIAPPAGSTPGLLGLVSYEGYSSTGPLGQAPEGITLPPGAFLLHLSGQYNNNTAAAFRLTNTSACSCAGYAQLPGLNHFGINNWQGPGRRQVTPCARPGRSDPPGFTVSSSRQAEALQQQAQLIDRFVRAWVLQDAGAGQALQQQAGGNGAAPRLQLKGQCFNKQ